MNTRDYQMILSLYGIEPSDEAGVRELVLRLEGGGYSDRTIHSYARICEKICQLENFPIVIKNCD